MIAEENTTSEKREKWLKFLGGFLGWFLVNTVIYTLVNLGNPRRSLGYGAVIWIPVLLINLIVLTVLTTLKKTRTIAFGILCALALNFIIATLFLTPTDAYCFIPVTYPVYDKPYIRPTPASQTPRPAPTKGNAKPIGFHDGNAGQVDLEGCVAFGWATDPDDRNIDLTVRVLSDGEEVARQVANTYRSDLNVADGCPGGTCGYLFQLKNLISHNQEHTILVQAQDAQTGTWSNLNATPKKLECR